MPQAEPDSDAIEAWLEGTLAQEEVAAIDAYFEANPDALPGASEEEDFAEMADYEPETGASLNALVERMKTNPGLESQWTAPSSDTEWQELLEPGPMLGILGPYEVEELIATGGMGILFKARDPKLARTVALKVLSPQLATNATARERFLREARAAAKLEHENILPIYAVHDGAVPYFSMRYADGGTLEELIKKSGTLDLGRLKSVGRQVSSALEAAHEGGVIHRDIKPANILLEAGGELCWVCDFGIARSVEDPSLTYAGNIAGTPHHMSPEQAEGKALDGRSDLFSLGTVLYRAATGQHAFTGDTTVSVLKSVAGDQPKPANEINAELPEWFEHLLATLLAKDPGNRPPDATAVIKALDAESAPPPPKPRRPAAIAWVGLAALIALLAVVAFLVNRNPDQADQPYQLEAGAIALTSFEESQPGLIDLSADPEFGSTAELVSSGQGITCGRNAARATLVTDHSNPAVDPTFQNIVRLDIGEIKNEFTADRKLKVDYLFEGTAGAHGDLALAYFDNRSGELHLFQRTDFQKSEGSPSTMVFDLDSPGRIGKVSTTQSLADLVADDFGKAILNLIAVKDAATAGTITIDNLRFLPGPASRTDPTPVSADGFITIEGDTTRYTDLAQAIDAARDGATLLLSGDIHCAETISTRPGQSIHLRPAPGATPSVIANDPLKTTLLFRGHTTIEGIRFSRPNAARNSLPIVSTINSPSVVVTDCMFQTSPVAENRLGGGALGASARSSKFIRCRFDTPGNAAILINGGEIHIEECVAVGHRFIYRRERTPNSSAEIVIERSVALCGELFSGSHHNPLYPTSLTVRDSLLDLRDQLLVLPDSPAELISENLRWTGENNHYPPNLTILTAPRMSAGSDFVPSTFEAFSDLPKANENNPTYGEIFDLERLPERPTAADVRAALRSGVPWPVAP